MRQRERQKQWQWQWPKRSKLGVGFGWEGVSPTETRVRNTKVRPQLFHNCSFLETLCQNHPFLDHPGLARQYGSCVSTVVLGEVCVWFPQKASEQIPATKIPHKTVEVVFKTDSRKYKWDKWGNKIFAPLSLMERHLESLWTFNSSLSVLRSSWDLLSKANNQPQFQSEISSPAKET